MIRKNTINGNWGLDRIDQFYLPLDNLYITSRTGKNVDVCIIDSGIAKNHAEFNLISVNTLYDFRNYLPKDNTNYIDISSPFYGYDDNGHGTFIASIVTGFSVGVATKANLYSIKSFDRNLNYTTKSIVDGLDSVLNFHLSKMPFRPTILYIPFSDIEYSIPIKNKIIQLYSSGIIIVVSAGNNGENVENSFPANIPGLIVVGGSDKNDNFMNPALLNDLSFKIKSFREKKSSNYGEKIDIIAPGFKIKGAWLPKNINTSNNFYINQQEITEYTEMSGNDVAGAFVVGAACLYLQENQTATINDVRNFLNSNSTKNVLKIRKEFIKTPNKLLRIPFRATNILWSIEENTILGEFNEGDSISIKIESFINDISGKKVSPKYSIYTGSLPSGIILDENGVISGKAPLINQFMPGYVSKNSLPIEDQIKFSDKQIGFIDFSFSVLADYDFNSSTINLKIRIIDLNEPPYWLFDNFFDINSLVSSHTFYYKNYVNIDISNIVIDTNNDNIVFSLLNNSLPENLSINSSGKITGTVKQVYPEIFTYPVSAGLIKRDYYFTIRATDGYEKIDKWCKITVYRDGSNNSPPVIQNKDYEVSSLGTFSKGTPVLIPLDVVDNDGDDIELYEVSASVSGIDVSASGVFFGLPYGLTINGNNIEGIIDYSNIVGNYYFGIAAFDGWDETRKTFHIFVEEINVSSLNNLAYLNWITASGKLGEIYETYTSHFFVKGVSSDNDPLIYSLVTSSNSLPPGLVLDSNTGYIKGKVGYVGMDTDYNFIVKISKLSSPSIFLNRKFSIRVLKKWGQPVSEFYYYLSGNDKFNIKNLIKNDIYEMGIVTSSVLYRPEDENYDCSIEPKIFIVGGIGLKTNNELFSLFDVESSSNTTLQKSYFREIEIKLGNFDVANVRNNEGELLCELIYLKVYDENENSLGVIGSSKIVYDNPNTNHIMNQFYVTGIRTWRNKIILDGGLVNNTEKLPQWMISPQVSANANDIPNYVPCLEILYVKPGSGNNIVLGLNNILGNKIYGRKIKIDRLVYEDLTDVNNAKKKLIKFVPGDNY